MAKIEQSLVVCTAAGRCPCAAECYHGVPHYWGLYCAAELCSRYLVDGKPVHVECVKQSSEGEDGDASGD